MHLGRVAAEANDVPSHRSWRARSWRFEVGLLVAIVLAGVLAWLARSVAYFPVDVEVTRAIQRIENPAVVAFLRSIAWIGFPPQSNLIFGAIVLALVTVGLWREAIMTFVAAAGSASLWFLIVPIVGRPRPDAALVRVAMELPTGGFPSGHVLNLTATFGFLVYLAIVVLPKSHWSALLAVLLAVPILAVGVARVYDGAHWPSDVLGGYLIGGIWLSLTIQVYRLVTARWPHAVRSRRNVERRHSTEHPTSDAPIAT